MGFQQSRAPNVDRISRQDPEKGACDRNSNLSVPRTTCRLARKYFVASRPRPKTRTGDKQSSSFYSNQRRRDDNKNKIFSLFEGGGGWGQRGKSSKTLFFRGKCHDNKILKVQILLSRYFVVIAHAPTKSGSRQKSLQYRLGGAKSRLHLIKTLEPRRNLSPQGPVLPSLVKPRASSRSCRKCPQSTLNYAKAQPP